MKWNEICWWLDSFIHFEINIYLDIFTMIFAVSFFTLLWFVFKNFQLNFCLDHNKKAFHEKQKTKVLFVTSDKKKELDHRTKRTRIHYWEKRRIVLAQRFSDQFCFCLIEILTILPKVLLCLLQFFKNEVLSSTEMSTG